MAIKEAKTNTDLDALFTQLAEPFDPWAAQVGAPLAVSLSSKPPPDYLVR